MSNKKPTAHPARPQQLQTIDPTALAQVSGGVATVTSTDDSLTTALSGILTSLQQLGTNNSSSGGAFGMNSTEMMMFMMCMEQRNEQNSLAASNPWGAPPVVYY